MRTLLPLVLLSFAAAGGTLDNAPHRTDVPDAILVRQLQPLEPPRYEPSLAPGESLLNVLKRLKADGTRFEVVGDEIHLIPPTFGPWRDLFNGKDLDNWKVVGKAIWKVEEGVIVGGQFGDPKRGGLLHTADSFTDFELELEFMIDEHGKYNSGVYLRNDAGTAARTGYQVNIGRGAAGEFCGGVYTTDWLAKGDETDTVRKVGEWNKFRILAIGAKVEVDLNGKRIVTLIDAKPDTKFLQRGVIGFQTYGAENHDGWVKFKNIRIREVKK